MEGSAALQPGWIGTFCCFHCPGGDRWRWQWSTWCWLCSPAWSLQSLWTVLVSEREASPVVNCYCKQEAVFSGLPKATSTCDTSPSFLNYFAVPFINFVDAKMMDAQRRYPRAEKIEAPLYPVRIYAWGYYPRLAKLCSFAWKTRELHCRCFGKLLANWSGNSFRAQRHATAAQHATRHCSADPRQLVMETVGS